MLRGASAKFSNSNYTVQKGDSGWVPTSFTDVDKLSDRLAAALLQKGFVKNDKIAILAEGRTNWVIGEFGIIKAGCISVPLSIKLLPTEVPFRLNHSESKGIVVSHNTFDKIAQIWEQIENQAFKLIYLDTRESLQKLCANKYAEVYKNTLVFSELLAEGEKLLAADKNIVQSSVNQIVEEDTVSIQYTSGTTGNPKGIMLTHLNYYSNCMDAMRFFDVREKDRLFIILPLDHSFAHTVGIYASLIRGLSIYFVDARGGSLATLKNIPVNMKEAQADFMLTVPALTSNFMNKITEGIEKKGGFAKKLFQAGLNAGMKLNGNGYRKADFFTRLIHYPIYKLTDTLVFSKVREIFGGNMKYCVGGGALLDIRQQRFFAAIGIPIYQGYGLTEAAPIISSNTPEMHKMGTSGKVLPSIECKIMDDKGNEMPRGKKGEIVIRGENVMKGYFKNETATAETIRANWLYTGDLGYMDKDNFLMVTGREKALLISGDGEKYSPEGIEEAIVNSSALVEQCLVYNDHNKYTTAIITLNSAKVAALKKEKNITEQADLLTVIKESFFAFVATEEYAGQFPAKWIPGTFQIVEEAFSEQNFMINSTMKMVRYKIVEAYQKQIDYMYSGEGSRIENPNNLQVLENLFFK